MVFHVLTEQVVQFDTLLHPGGKLSEIITYGVVFQIGNNIMSFNSSEVLIISVVCNVTFSYKWTTEKMALYSMILG